MPPSSPAGVAAQFQKRVNDLLRDFDELLLAVHEKRRQASLEGMIAEQIVLLTAVLWEAFISDLLIAYIARDPTSCFKGFKERIHQTITDKYAGAIGWVSVRPPKTISKLQAEKLLDPKGRNLTAGSAEDLSDFANRHLNATDAKKFSLEADDRDFIGYLVSLRNYLSHRSSGSRLQLVASAAALKPAGQNAELAGPIQSLPVYLKGPLANGKRRVNIIGQRVVQISAKLL